MDRKQDLDKKNARTLGKKPNSIEADGGNKILFKIVNAL